MVLNFRVLLCAALLFSVAACSNQHTRNASAQPVTPTLDISAMPGWHQPRPNLYTAGQPSVDDWKSLAASGVTTVVNLRTDGEMTDRDEAAEVRAAGMRYQSIPVGGAADVTAANANTLWQLLESTKGGKLVHCASGNRVGALLALGAAQQGGMSAEDALAFGKASGLTRLEPVVREKLGLPPAD